MFTSNRQGKTRAGEGKNFIEICMMRQEALSKNR